MIEGWVLTGHLKLDETVRLSEVPVVADLPDHDPDTINSQTLLKLYSVPVLSEIQPDMQAVYERRAARK